MKVGAVIPCRYRSVRLEGKPLALIGDKPMFWHVYRRARLARALEEVHVATDDSRIFEACRALDVPVLMTAPTHLTGTDRVAECARMLDADIVVNIQGDEPFIDPEAIDAVADALVGPSGVGIDVTNACAALHALSDCADPGIVKVVCSQSHRALAYSRLPIPLAFRAPAPAFRQLGLYAFRREALEFFARTPQGPLERAESVELYRFLEHDRAVRMVEVIDDGIAVDTPADLERARARFENRAPRSEP
jgi:3-deoxy-manno-octulosonate cytidylyltransferase (CMP-KDO synthetase)